MHVYFEASIILPVGKSGTALTQTKIFIANSADCDLAGRKYGGSMPPS
jgi:hypothetical protein